MKKISFLTLLFITLFFSEKKLQAQTSVYGDDFTAKKLTPNPKFLNPPLVSEIYTADPSAHVFGGRIYIYGSHDIESTVIDDDCGSQYSMRDYRVLSMDSVGGPVTVHKVGLDLDDVPWATRQFWAPDAAYKNGKYYLYFPSKDKDDRFRIGVAVSSKPEGPFVAEPNFIPGSYSIDPAVFTDDDGSSYMYFGGIWGGQLQRWENNTYEDSNCKKQDRGNPQAPAILPRIAKMSDDMLTFNEEVKEVMILDENGNPILTKDHNRRFFEAAWIHKYKGVYYLSYSTGNTHYLQYATGDNPYGPFVYKGIMNQPVKGWTNHHSVVEINDQWYLFYHDIELSNQTNLRNIKMTELTHNEDGSIQTINTILD